MGELRGAADKKVSRWHSERLNQEVMLARWGHWGQPVLLFPTAGGDAEEAERFLMMKALGPLLDQGRIKVYACDSVAGRAWIDRGMSGRHKAAVQNAFDGFVHQEVLKAIRLDCNSADIEVISAGASIGAFNALAVLCRHPDVFKSAICMSGTYDLTRWMNNEATQDFYFSSPLHFLPNLGDSPQLHQLRHRFVLLASGEGRFEAPGESWQVANVLGAKGIPNRVDLWGKDVHHDWVTWRRMLPHYLSQMT